MQNYLEERGYIRRTSSDLDKREFRIEPSKRYREEYGVIFDYIHLVCDRIEERFTPSEIDKFEEMLGIISEELMPEAGSQLIERKI